MLRPELQALASAGATVLIDGRVLEMRRNAPGTVDLLLKHCRVRQIQQGQPQDTHPQIHTDHLWVRFSDSVLQAEPAPKDVPHSLGRLLARPALELLERIRLVGVAGFYTHGGGQLGIGITKVVPTISEQRLQGLVLEAQACFLSHPWRAECLATLTDVVAMAQGHLRDGVVVLTHPAADVIATLDRMLERCRRDHAAEAKARAGHRRSRMARPQGPLLTPVPDAQALLIAGRGQSGLDQLLSKARGCDGVSRRYGWLGR